jgi:hypothetical protein
VQSRQAGRAVRVIRDTEERNEEPIKAVGKSMVSEWCVCVCVCVCACLSVRACARVFSYYLLKQVLSSHLGRDLHRLCSLHMSDLHLLQSQQNGGHALGRVCTFVV